MRRARRQRVISQDMEDQKQLLISNTIWDYPITLVYLPLSMPSSFFLSSQMLALHETPFEQVLTRPVLTLLYILIYKITNYRS